jgi:hypothetical protein
MPLTTSTLEQLTRPIYAALYPRRDALKNRERLYRLLMLMQPTSMETTTSRLRQGDPEAPRGERRPTAGAAARDRGSKGLGLTSLAQRYAGGGPN